MASFKRPRPGETEEDILRMQEEFVSEKPSIQLRRVGTKADRHSGKGGYGKVLGPTRNFVEGGRFTVDLGSIEEEHVPQQVVFHVQEKNVDVLGANKGDSFKRYTFEMLNYSKEDGFPEVIDLSTYYKNGADLRRAPPGMSFFAAEFDRLHGRLEEAVIASTSVNVDGEAKDESMSIHVENEKKIAAMNQEEIARARMEIEEKLDPKLIEFLKNRRCPPQKEQKSGTKVSRFKMERQDPASVLRDTKSKTEVKPIISEMVKQLEVIEEYADRKAEEKYSRLAADAVQLDFASKCARTMLPRQSQNAVRLFDNLKTSAGCADKLLELARSKIDDIKLLYLEEVENGGSPIQQFARGLNPVVDGCWMLRPIRTVLDAVQSRQGLATTDDTDIVRLCVLWSTLLFCERGSLFHTTVEPADFYVRLAELFLIGPETFTDEIVEKCVDRLLDGFLIPAAVKGRLSMRLSSPVAGLDAFMPFFEELLQKFEEFSTGNWLFTKVLLAGAYLNSSWGDGLECQVALWSGRRHLIRETTASAEQLGSILSVVGLIVEKMGGLSEEQYYVQYSSLLSEYASALSTRRVTRERNSAVFEIAAEELRRFLTRHTHEQPKEGPCAERVTEFDSLVGAVRRSVEGLLPL